MEEKSLYPALRGKLHQERLQPFLVQEWCEKGFPGERERGWSWFSLCLIASEHLPPCRRGQHGQQVTRESAHGSALTWAAKKLPRVHLPSNITNRDELENFCKNKNPPWILSDLQQTFKLSFTWQKARSVLKICTVTLIYCTAGASLGEEMGCECFTLQL